VLLEEINTCAEWRTHVFLKTVFRIFMVKKKKNQSFLLSARMPNTTASANRTVVIPSGV
jgi:hypothetical protein